MVQITIKPHRDYNKGTGDESIVSWDLIINSNDQEMLESLKDTIQDMFMRCDNCYGEVVKSDDMYLCLNGCGHVKAETRTKSKPTVESKCDV